MSTDPSNNMRTMRMMWAAFAMSFLMFVFVVFFINQKLTTPPPATEQAAQQPLVPIGHDIGRPGGERPQHHYCRISRNELHQKEADQRDAKQLRPNEQHALGNIT